MRKLTLVLMVCVAVLMSAKANATLLDVHDARADGAKNSPVNGQWSYRTAEWNAGGTYGDLLTWYGPGNWTTPGVDQWGFGEHYGIGDPSQNLRPLFDVDADGLHPGNYHPTDNVQDPLNEQVGGHGNYMLRWTADADTASKIQISGYIYNAASPSPTWWKVLKNDSNHDPNNVVAAGYTATSGTVGGGDFVNLAGYGNRLTFADSLANGSLTISVAPGDTIDIVTPPSEHADHPGGPPRAQFMKYIITEIPEPTTMSLMGLGLGSLLALRRRRPSY